MTNSSVFLLIASLSNLTYSILLPKLYDVWFYTIHVSQLVFILLAAICLFIPGALNRINKYAFIAYLAIVLSNRILFLEVLIPSSVAQIISISTGVLYPLSLLIILIKERWT